MKTKLLCISALVAAFAGGYWYNSRKPEAKNKDFAIELGKGAREYLDTGMSRMRLAGADYSPVQLVVILKDADANKDNRIDLEEAKDLYNDVLNPDMPLGKLALQYRGPENPEIQHSVRIPEKWEKTLTALIDENKDYSITKEELYRGGYKMEH